MIEIGSVKAGRDVTITANDIEPILEALTNIDSPYARYLVQSGLDLVRTNPEPKQVQTWFDSLVEIAPDIISVAIAALTGPLAAIGVIIERLADKSVKIHKSRK